MDKFVIFKDCNECDDFGNPHGPSRSYYNRVDKSFQVLILEGRENRFLFSEKEAKENSSMLAALGMVGKFTTFGYMPFKKELIYAYKPEAV